MLWSKTYIPTLKEVPSDAEIKSHKLLLKAGYIKKNSSGVYTFLPLGLKVLRNIENIVRNEMEAISVSEILMPVLQSKDLWEKTDRWNEYGSELFRITDRHENEFALGPTHEEIITDLVKNDIVSYKRLPLTLFQIQTKFRDEMRPRFGLMRCREFLMFDAYSFNESVESLDESFIAMKRAYISILEKLKLDYKIVIADSGQIGGSESLEFMIPSEVGEDTICFEENSNIAYNIEKIDESEISKYKTAKTIEVGHIFKLGNKYTNSFNVKYSDRDQKQIDVQMGCYGIGISRLVMALIESMNDEDKLLWNENVAPYKYYITFVNKNQEEAAKEIYNKLIKQGAEVIFDDRDERLGVKLNDVELIGIPHIIICGKNTDNGEVEYKNRIVNSSENRKIEEILTFK